MRMPLLLSSGTRSAFAAVVLVVLAFAGCSKSTDPFIRLTNLGKSQLEGGDASKAVDFFRQALALQPTLLEAHLNLANAYLLANQPDNVLQQTRQALQLDPNSAAAHYLAGCAYLRLGQAEEALKSFQQSHRIDPAVTALNFQLALAHERLRSEEHTSELQSLRHLVCRLLLEKKKTKRVSETAERTENKPDRSRYTPLAALRTRPHTDATARRKTRPRNTPQSEPDQTRSKTPT